MASQLSTRNPMMDGLVVSPPPAALDRCRRVLLLCGSRMPEAQTNFRRLLAGLKQVNLDQPLAVLVPVGNQPDRAALQTVLEQQGFRQSLPPSDRMGAEACWVRESCLLLIGRGCFHLWAGWVSCAPAGTATEQLVGWRFQHFRCLVPDHSSSRDLLGAKVVCSVALFAPVPARLSW